MNEGDEILYAGETSLYLYTVDSVDADNGEVTVTDKTTSDQMVLQLNRNATKKVLIVPYIGYALLALNSRNGLAMLISGAVVLVALYILASVWDKRRKDRLAAQYDEDEEYFTALAESVDKPSKLDEVLYRPSTPAPEQAPQTADAPTVEMPGIRSAEQADFQEEEELFPGLSSEPVTQESLGETIMVAAPAAEQNVPDERAAAGMAAGIAAAGIAAAEAPEAGIFEEAEALPEEEPVKEKAEEKAAEAIPAAAAVTAAAEAKEAGPEKKADGSRSEAPAAAKREAAAASRGETPAEPVKEEQPFDVEALAAVPDDNSPASLNISDNEIPDVSDALVAALETTQISRTERPTQSFAPVTEPVPAEEPDEIELAIPVKTANEILDEAYAKGYDPQVITDDVTGIKLVDFSDCYL